jgi:hypothetical protein
MNTQQNGPKYFLDIEGTEHVWNGPTVTATDIARLGGWDAAQGVLLIDAENNERQLQPEELVTITLGHGFARKVRWRRGLQTTPRLIEEIDLVRRHFSELEFVEAGSWVRIPGYRRPAGWEPACSEIAFQVPPGFPATPPYGFYVPVGSKFNGVAPSSYTEPADPRPPFDGPWGKFSWQPESADWQPKATVAGGSNLLSWVHGFISRFQEGA